ncbi:MAG: hypothetical protein WCT19_04595 [Candidatus Paceibacterota bacterium]
MNAATLPLSYLAWHYTSAFADTARIFSNLFWFLWHYFSIEILLKTLFSPWRRLHDDAGGGSRTENFLSGLVINNMMRFIGFFIRSFTIIFGLVVIVFTFIFAVLFFIFWAVLPIAVTVLLFLGAKILII